MIEFNSFKIGKGTKSNFMFDPLLCVYTLGAHLFLGYVSVVFCMQTQQVTSDWRMSRRHMNMF